MKLKTKLAAGAGSLLMASSMMALVAPAAHAVVTPMGSCDGAVQLVKLAGLVKGQGLGDQTAPVKVTGGLAKDQTLKTAIAGSCSGVVTKPGDLHVPGGNTPLTLHPKAQAISLSGNTSCANGAGAVAADATAANAFPLTGKITWTFNETYIDLINSAAKPYKMQAAISVLGFNAPAGPDVIDVGGVVLSGVDVGAQVSGDIFEDPVSLTHGASGFNTGYELDLISAAGCADATPGNANLTLVLAGGGPSLTSLLGSATTGLSFQAGEA